MEREKKIKLVNNNQKRAERRRRREEKRIPKAGGLVAIYLPQRQKGFVRASVLCARLLLLWKKEERP